MKENELKQHLSRTKLKADKELKDRIVHQIQTEKELMPSKSRVSNTSFGNSFSGFGIMYIVLLALECCFYSITDGKPLQSISFVVSAITVSSTFSIYWLITTYDDYKSNS